MPGWQRKLDTASGPDTDCDALQPVQMTFDLLRMIAKDRKTRMVTWPPEKTDAPAVDKVVDAETADLILETYNTFTHDITKYTFAKRVAESAAKFDMVQKFCLEQDFKREIQAAAQTFVKK